ncbi:MAG: DEAD/DEAH box helicase [Calditrichaeota bacterium]|nr:DEAD/DEAH box helicase [Calditrichota bacterium]
MAIRIEENEIYLGVKDLVHSSHQQMLSSFPLPQRGVLGKKAQSRVQQTKQKRFGLFHTEYTVKQSYPYRGYHFHIHGRVDGVYQLQDRLEIEEIKSVILTAANFKKLNIELYPHFSEQLLYYAYLLQDAFNGIEIQTYLILVNLTDNKQRVFRIPYKRIHTEQRLRSRFDQIIEKIELERRQLEKRKRQINQIDFSLPEERPQQQRMMQAIESAINEGRHLMASAPTGTGKTAASLYPAIQYSFVRNKKIFFITSKTSQQLIAAQTVRPLIAQGLPIKTMIISASEKMCLNDVYFCHESYCPYINKYRERLHSGNLLAELLNENFIDPVAISGRAAALRLCPFEVSMDLLGHVDLVIGDYNYVFDPAAQLRRLFAGKDYSDWILVIDEAHNLYDRGMNYLSPQISRKSAEQLTERISSQKSKIFKDLRDPLKQIEDLFNALQQEGELHHAHQQYYPTQLNVEAWDEVFRQFEASFIRYLIYKIRTRKLIIDDPLEKFYYDFRRFVKVAHIQDPAFVTYYDAQEGGILHIQCCDPSHYLGEIIDRFHSVIAMSATLDPMEFYRTILGFSAERTRFLQLDSPFPVERRKLIIVPNISTRYKDRLQSAPKIAEVIRRIIKIKKGNYLVFFPSFTFMQMVNLFLHDVEGEKILQKPGMKEKERDEILNGLKKGKEPHLLLAVMGGIFSEGVDFSGNMAIGVIVVGPALPQVNYQRELLRAYYEETYRMGEEYAYIYPGMNKVIQAVGRLIRSASDRGIVVLIGDRFVDERFNILLPEYWLRQKDDIEITSSYISSIKAFWKKQKSI